jgi:hypothetical protein
MVGFAKAKDHTNIDVHSHSFNYKISQFIRIIKIYWVVAVHLVFLPPVQFIVRLPNWVAPWQSDRLKLVFQINQFLSGMVDIICSESAAMVRLGFTPRFAETTDPSAT